MIEVAQFLARVDAVIADTLQVQRLRWVEVDQDLDLVFEEIEQLVFSGGKRLRPQFCWWGWIAAGGQDDHSAVVKMGAAIELLHVFALFHDDVIDNADTRRGKPTAHRSMMLRHEQGNWAGESRRFGEGAAVLIGDITHVIADSLMSDVSSQTRSIWNEMRVEVNIGQYLDTLGSARRERRPEVAERITRYKTAKYTIERPLHLGALAADVVRGHALSSMLSDYGLPLGAAFQMRDDVLGAFGDPVVTGKPVGDDFREGKPTLLLALTWAQATPQQLKVLDTVGSPTMTHSEIVNVQEVVRDTGALSDIESMIDSLRNDAVSSLVKKSLSGHSYEALVGLADSVTQRSI